MAGTSGHLTDETVAELLEGRLEGARFDRAESHLAECTACARLVTEARTGDGADGAAPEPLAGGARVGRYEILEPIGAGAMGRVYAARDPVLDRRVALKLLHPHVSTDAMESRLLREAKAMARISHPEVITVHDAGRYAGQIFVAMELVEGGTLRQWGAAHRRPWREVLAAYLRAGRGLARAHEAGIVHRDFKPDNVLVGHDGRVRVTDFGLARAPSAEAAPELHASPAQLATASTVNAELTRTGMLLGTPAYMAPEQHAGTAADERSDVYAFCVALFEALYGARPFGGSTMAALREEKLRGQPRLPPDTRGVPPRLRRAIAVGLRPRPEDRYASMNELLAALERAARTPRSWFVAGAAAAAVVALGAVAAVRTASGRAPAPHDHGSVPGLATAAGCASHRACVEEHGGAPYVCRASDRTCVPLASEDCTPSFEPADLTAEDTVWLGALLPVKGPPHGKMNMHAVDLARSEIAQQTGALTGVNAALHVRRIGVVGCDDTTDPMRAARHLVEDVGVPAIIGFGSGKEVLDVAGSLLIGRHVLTMSTLTSSPLITKLPQPPDLPRMVWRTTYNFEAAAEATAAFVHGTVEPLTRGGRTRVTLVRVAGAYALPFAQRFFTTLVFNGKPAVDDGDEYKEVTFEAEGPGDVITVAAKVVDGTPSIVVLLGGAEVTASIVEQVEARWPAGARKPFYVIAENTAAILGPFVGKSADRRHRVFAVSAAAVPVEEAHFVLRFNLAYPGEASLTINPASTYDGFYLLAYAVFAARDGAVTGPRLGEALATFAPPARPIDTGPAQLFTGITALSRGEALDLRGPSGSLDFDPATGELAMTFALLCPGVGPDGRAAADVESGVTFAAKTGVVGSPRCP